MIALTLALLASSPEVIFEAEAPIRSAVVASENVLFFGSEDCRFYAVDGSGGQELWSITTDDAVECRPVVTGERIVFNAANTLYVLDAKSGEEIARVELPASGGSRVSDDDWAWNDSSVAVDDEGDVWLAALNGDIFEVSDDVVRRHPARNRGNVACGVEYLPDGRLLWVDHAGDLVSLDAKSMRETFRTPVGDRIFAPMCVTGDRVYLAGRNCRMSCVDARTGEVLWTSFSKDPTTWFSGGSLVVGDVLWACTSDEFSMLLLDRESGEFRDLLPIRTNGYTQPVQWKECVIAVATDVYTLHEPERRRADVTIFDARTRSELHHWQIADGVVSSPAVSGDALYFGSESGRLYRLELPR